LYNWLDRSDRWLQPLLDKYRREGIVLAIATSGKLAHLPWEVLQALSRDTCKNLQDGLETPAVSMF
jgi:hypothetical protein